MTIGWNAGLPLWRNNIDIIYYLDKKSLVSILYILEKGAALKVKHQQFNVFQEKKLLCKVPVNQIDHIILFGYCHLSHGAVQTALFRKISITYYSSQGYYLGQLQSLIQPKLSYIRQQTECNKDKNFVRQQAAKIVIAKLHNSRILLMRLNRRNPNENTKKAITELKKIINSISAVSCLETLRGYEGKGSNIYFRGLSSLFRGEFIFTKRSSRPPTDPINSLLGYGYTLLFQHLLSIVQLAGLHTELGNLHTPRDNHPALVLDLMEEFRAQIVDSLIIYLVNKKIFSLQDFTLPNSQGAVYLKQDSLKIFLKHWSDKLSSELTHNGIQRKVSLRTCLELQVKAYISCLKGKTQNYQPMLWQK